MWLNSAPAAGDETISKFWKYPISEESPFSGGIVISQRPFTLGVVSSLRPSPFLQVYRVPCTLYRYLITLTASNTVPAIAHPPPGGPNLRADFFQHMGERTQRESRLWKDFVETLLSAVHRRVARRFVCTRSSCCRENRGGVLSFVGGTAAAAVGDYLPFKKTKSFGRWAVNHLSQPGQVLHSVTNVNTSSYVK